MRPFSIVASGIVTTICLLILQGTVLGYDIADKLSIGGVIAGAYQYQWADSEDNKGRGGLPFQPEFSFRPTEKDEIFVNFGFAYLNGKNDFDATQVFETYWRFVLTDYLAVTADLQFSDNQQSVGPAPSRGLPHTPSSAGGR